jgi:hypothetical protein
MAQRTITSTGINGGYDITGGQNTINYLKGVMVAGAKVYAADVNSLIALWNSFNSHTHGITDAYQLATYGNNGDRNNYYENDTTNGPNLNGDIGLISNTTVISSAKINELVNGVANGANHSHTWSDRTG